MHKAFLFFAASALFISCAFSQQFDFNARCIEAYRDIQELRFADGTALLQKEKQENPDNLIPWFVENYIDFLTTYIDEDPVEFDKLEPNKNLRLDKLKDGDRSSPYYLYTQAEIMIQWAFARLKYGEYVSAFTEVKKAYDLLEDNTNKFPDFVADRKSLGMLHAIVGAIPDQYKWGVNILGMNGTVEEGLGEMQSIIDYAKNHSFVFLQETYLYYAFLSLYLNKDDQTAWDIVKGLDTKNNLMNVFCVASIAMRTGRNDTAIGILSSRPSGPGYFSFNYLDFMLGLAKTRRLDADASTYLQKYIREFGGRNYIKEAYQKIAWNDLLHGDIKGYDDNMALVKTQGDDVIDDDKQALYEAENGERPDVTLLRSRLLFDGGYYKDALRALEGKSTEDFNSAKDKAEFTYRAGRIYHAAGYPDKAKGYYLATIQIGKDLPNYFAAGAAYQLGTIYEESGDYDKARYYYQACIDMPNKEYATSMKSLAKAGLNRIKGK